MREICKERDKHGAGWEWGWIIGENHKCVMRKFTSRSPVVGDVGDEMMRDVRKGVHTVCAMVLDDSVRNQIDPLGDRDPLRTSPRDMAGPSLGLGVRLVGGQRRRRLWDNVCGRLLLLLLLLLLCCSEAPLCTDMLVSSSRDPAWLNRI